MRRFTITWCVLAVLGGCSWYNGLTMRSQSPEEPLPPEKPRTRLVSDYAVPTGMEPVRVEAVGLVGGLHGTGSDPGPSPQRGALLDEMQKRGVDKPNHVLASGNVSLVLVRGWLRVGIQKGDRFDIEVRSLSRSETTSLRGGYLLETRLQQMAVLGNQVRPGHLLALAEGPVLVDPAAGPKDRVLLCRGRVLGGGVALKSRPMGLVLTPGNQNVLNSSRVANAVNRRFHTFRNGLKTGMAKAKTDEYIELCIHPRYKDNIARYVRVVRALPVSESAPEQMQRVAKLKELLLDPLTAAAAAIQLEALGSEGEDALLEGIRSKNPETRFYAAEALAYLDRREAAEPLAEIARNQPAFRVFALTALSVMTDYIAYEQLCELLSVPSAETRYGAFRALWAMNDQDPLIKGEVIGDQFHYHVLDVAGPPMIHVTRNRLPEIVVFGPGQRLLTPLALSAGNEVMITSHGGDEISVSKYTVRDGDQKRIVSTRVDDVIRAVVELGGTYPDVVQALQEAKNCEALCSRFEVDALPEAGRIFDRDVDGMAETEQGEQGDGQQPSVKSSPESPSPELFHQRGGTKSKADQAADDNTQENTAEENDSNGKSNTKKGFFARMLGR
ncbi:MAG: flagellar basal body P-ring protein FlgI [Planctomycetes bacterium]|nr:flagellar basal body P-ring protein FlgI [Planctomycetota bacterium]